MRAAVCDSYGPPEVIRVADVETPEPAAGEILVQVAATVVSAADAAGRSGTPPFARFFFGLRRPRQPVLGGAFSGEVTAVGPGVTAFPVGDPVVGVTPSAFGAHAEYVRLPVDGVVLAKPSTLSHVDAVGTIGGPLTALPFLRDLGGLQSGQRVVIIGAAGSVGSAAVQIARAYGAHVTGVCSAANAGLVQELGAHEVIDYAERDFAAGSPGYDVVFDAVGKSSYRHSRRVLSARGVYLSTVPSIGLLARTAGGRILRRQRAAIAMTGLRPTSARLEDLRTTFELVATGRYRPVIDSVVPLDRIVEAHRRVDSGHKRGDVVVVNVPTAP